MPDWTSSFTHPGEPPPGAVNPPPPDQIQPTDPGWAGFVRRETDKTGLKWGPACSVSLEVAATGKTMLWPLDGDNPTDYAADKDWGWKEDRTYETQPPEPYQDFTRWVRHYPRMRRQRYVEYEATVYVRCGAHFVNTRPTRFWAPDGPPVSGPVDAFLWTKTSGMKTGEDGKSYKWTTTGKKTPPSSQGASPDASWLEPNETPPYWVMHPYDFSSYKAGLKLGYDWKYDDWKLRYEWYAPRAMPVEPGTKTPNWFRMGDVFGTPRKPNKKKPKRR